MLTAARAFTVLTTESRSWVLLIRCLRVSAVCMRFPCRASNHLDRGLQELAVVIHAESLSRFDKGHESGNVCVDPCLDFPLGTGNLLHGCIVEGAAGYRQKGRYLAEDADGAEGRLLEN